MTTTTTATRTRAALSGCPVVVKRLADELAGDPVLRARFQRAAELGMRLSHPNVVRIFEAGVDPRPYVVMEDVGGATLTERIAQNGRLSTSETLTLATHLAAGLAHAHANGVVHGALSADSIVVGDDSVARITEFGFARLADGEARPTPADDVYGLAMVLRHTAADPLPANVTALIDAATAHPSVRPSAFDVFHHLHTITAPGAWLPPAGVRALGDTAEN